MCIKRRTSFLMMLLPSPKSKPALLGRSLLLFLRFRRRCSRLALNSLGLLCCAVRGRVLHIIPRNIQKEGLHRDRLHLGRVRDDVLEVNPLRRVLTKPVNQRPGCHCRGAFATELAQVGNLHKRSVPLQLAFQKCLQRLSILLRNLHGLEPRVLASTVTIENWHSSLHLVVCMLCESQRICGIANQQMRATNGQGSENVFVSKRTGQSLYI